MRLLLDENMPHDFRHYLPGHDARTVDYMRWKGRKNGELLALARDEFDVLITLDKNIPDQQNITPLDVGVMILIARTNSIESLRPLVPQILERLRTIRRGEVVRICPPQAE